VGESLEEMRISHFLNGSASFRQGLANPIPPASKRYKCPYCTNDITNLHDWKSHLLAHLHEKHYMCKTCGSRYRDLTDLMRHGFQFRICPKCGRFVDNLRKCTRGPCGCSQSGTSNDDTMQTPLSFSPVYIHPGDQVFDR